MAGGKADKSSIGGGTVTRTASADASARRTWDEIPPEEQAFRIEIAEARERSNEKGTSLAFELEAGPPLTELADPWLGIPYVYWGAGVAGVIGLRIITGK